MVTDYATKYIEAKAYKDKSIKVVSKALIDTLFLRHAPPRMIRTDCGLEFTAKLIEEICKFWGTIL